VSIDWQMAMNDRRTQGGRAPDLRRTALVTGATRGIGFEVCRQLGQCGMRVLLGTRDHARGGAAAAVLVREGLDVRTIQLDVTDPADLRSLLATSRAVVDVLVNNAGVDYDTDRSAPSADLARVRTTLETNLFGAWATAQAFAPGMRQRLWGRIVNVSSSAGSLSEMANGPPGYSVSKAALNAFTRLLSAELAGTCVLVNSVCPGWVATDMGGVGGRPVRDGAASVVWAVQLPDDGPTGGFFRDGAAVAW
jgi:NAD(P)-dependent dehydrogenase (short-subunit alcohol dehydrogenase family)